MAKGNGRAGGTRSGEEKLQQGGEKAAGEGGGGEGGVGGGGERAEARGLLCRDHQRVRPTPLGRRFLNDLVQLFLA